MTLLRCGCLLARDCVSSGFEYLLQSTDMLLPWSRIPQATEYHQKKMPVCPHEQVIRVRDVLSRPLGY